MSNTTTSINALADLLASHSPTLVLTGAGISTQSGIPAYRDATGQWVQPQPVKAAEFKKYETTRQRYWRRSMNGWPTFQAAAPNPAHFALHELQQSGLVSTIITQNVDGLHQSAGSKNVIDLHGSLSKVICLQCSSRMDRFELQEQLVFKNPDFHNEQITIGPDGDATPVGTNRPDTDFQLVDCSQCGGTLKPDVVFFGENVPPERVAACMAALESANSLLCIGSSLSVLSGFRFCREAVKQNKPVLLINQGQTRADDIAALKVEAECGSALHKLLSIARN